MVYIGLRELAGLSFDFDFAQVGGTAMIGTYLLAPATVAVLMPVAIATVVALPPAAAITTAAGTFLKSLLQRQGQVEHTCSWV
jgi:hypothetical protein